MGSYRQVVGGAGWFTMSLRLVSLCLLLADVGGDWEQVGERVLHKIRSGLHHTIMNVKTCGLPTITNAPKNLTLNTGDTARFYCAVDMSCMVSYIEWHKHDDNGTLQLLRKGTDPGDPYSFSIEGVAQDHTGLYSCIAGNILGETIETAFLKINMGGKISLDLYLALMGSLVSR